MKPTPCKQVKTEILEEFDHESLYTKLNTCLSKIDGTILDILYSIKPSSAGVSAKYTAMLIWQL